VSEAPYEGGQLASTWEMLYKDGEGNGHIETLHKYIYNDDANFEPAVPARITPSRAKPKQRDYRVHAFLGDEQIGFRRLDDGSLLPLHDPRAMAAAALLLKDVQPDSITGLGDTTDFAEISRFDPDSDHFHRTLGPSFQATHNWYAQLRADNPRAAINLVDSNHNERLKKFVLRHMPQFYGFKRANESDEYPMMTFPYLANLQHLDINWVSGYGGAEVETAPTLWARHGTEFGANAAQKVMSKNPEINSVQGHAHRESRAVRTSRDGRYLTSLIVPALCKIDGTVPGMFSAVDDFNEPVKKQEQHQNGLLIVEEYDEGEFVYNSIPIIGGVIKWRGRVYDGTQ
jgi:hypothetical protein